MRRRPKRVYCRSFRRRRDFAYGGFRSWIHVKGALLWPAFWMLTLFDALLLGELPIAGDDGTDLVPALLLSGFFNLVAVGLLAACHGRLSEPDSLDNAAHARYRLSLPSP